MLACRYAESTACGGTLFAHPRTSILKLRDEAPLVSGLIPASRAYVEAAAGASARALAALYAGHTSSGREAAEVHDSLMGVDKVY